MKKLILSVLFTFLIGSLGFSQVTTSKIQGIITDDASNGLFGANMINDTQVLCGTNLDFNGALMVIDTF